MTAVPNMTVLAPCDPAETALVTRECIQVPGPVYLRLGKAGEPDLTSTAPDPFRLGKIRFIKRGADICFLSYGPVTKTAVEVANRMEKEKGKSCAVVSVHSLKPLDKTGIQEMLARFPIVVVVEEHAPHGGLGSRVKEIAWDSGAQCRLKPFSLRDEFIHVYGSHADLLKAHGLDPETIYAEACSLAKM